MAASCPHCRSADVQALAGDWQCLNCQTHFSEGDRPERKGSGTTEGDKPKRKGGGTPAPRSSKKSATGITTSKDVLKKAP